MGVSVGGVLVVVAALAAVSGLLLPSGSEPAAATSRPARKAIEASAKVLKPPAHSGHGRRVVFDQSAQRVWLVLDEGTVIRTYLVTGSKDGNLRVGTYEVQGRSRQTRAAVGRGTIEFFVRFTQGRHAAIGFHAVTISRYGNPVYSREEMGTPRTPGCVEALREDAEALWDFAPVGTPVVVTA